MVKNYSNTNNIKNEKIKLKDSNVVARQYHPASGSDSSVNFSSLQQGEKYNKNKKKLKNYRKEGFLNNAKEENYLTAPIFRKAYETRNEPLSRNTNTLIEGFTDEQYNSIQKIENINTDLDSNSQELQNLYDQFNSKIDEYSAEKSRISDITQNYLLRTGSSHSYHGKNVQTDDGIKGYVTNKGVFKKYTDDATYQSIVGKGSCPKNGELVTIESTLDNLSNSMSPMIQGSNMNSHDSKARYVRIEGKNQYLHIQELEIYSGDTNISKLTTEIQENTANENETFDCSGTVFYGKKYVNGNSGDIANYDQLIQSDYNTLDNSGNFTCSNSSFADGTYSEEREYPPVPISLSTTISGRASTSTGTVSGQSYGNGSYTISVKDSQHNINSSIENGNLTLMSKQPKIGTQLGGTAVYPVYYNTIQVNNIVTITFPVTIYFTKVIITGYQSNSIYNPQAISVEGSTDGSTFTTIGGSNKYDETGVNLTFTATTQTELKYIKLTETTNAKNAVWSEIYTYGKEKGTGDPLPGTKKQCICKIQKGGASVTTSSTGWNGKPGYIIDGNKDDNQPWPNSNHTQKGKNEWIELDLKDEYSISRITLYNRPDCCQDRLNGAIMKLLDANRKQVYPNISLTGERLQEFMIRTLPRGQTCGNEGKNVYVNEFPNVKDNQPTYLGCYNDNSDRRMEWDGAPYMSFDNCKQKAIDSKSSFFALQDTRSDGTSACMLSNNIIKSTSDGKAVAYDFTWATNSVTSAQNTYYLFLDYDGNLMIKDSANNDNIVWQTNTGSTDTDEDSYIKFKKTDFPGNDIEGKAMKRADCETHCNDLNDCVGYNSSRSSNFCWFKKSFGNKSDTNSWNFFMKGRKTFLVMKNNGDLVLYTGHPGDGTKTSKRKVLWSSNTASDDGLVIEEWKPDRNGGNKYKTNYLLPGQSLESNKLISSVNGKRIAIMQSDGNFVIYKGSSKCVDKDDYIGGAPWTNAIYMLNNTKFKSETGKFVGGEPVSDITPKYERVQLGDCLSYCENSNECNSFSFGKEQENSDFDTCLLYRNVPESRDNNKKMKSYQTNLSNPFISGWKNAGKMGYVDENAVLHEMSDKYKSWGDEYVEYPNTNSAYNDIKTGIIGDTSVKSAIDQVKEMCNNDPNCAGFVFSPTDNKYWLKNENMYPIGNKTSNVNDVNLYVRKRAVNANQGCTTNVESISSMQWENYEKGNMYNDDMKCGLSTTLDNTRLYQLESELTNILKQISEKMKEISESSKTNSVEYQRQMLMMEQRFKELENTKKQIENIEPVEEKEDILDETLNRKDQQILPSLFEYWFKNSTNVSSSEEGTGQTAGVQTSSGSASEELGCENQAACMDDLTSYNQEIPKESFTTLTTPFEEHKEDLSILALGTLGIIGTMIAFNSCSKCK